MLIRKVMEFRKAAKLVFELRSEKRIESSEDQTNVQKARRMFGGPEEGSEGQTKVKRISLTLG